MFKWQALLVRCKLVGSILVFGAPLGDAFNLDTGAALDPYLIFGCYVFFSYADYMCSTLTWAFLLPCLFFVYSVTLSLLSFLSPPVPSLGVICRNRSV